MKTLLRSSLVVLAALVAGGALGADPYRDFRDRRDRDEDVIAGFYQRYLSRSPGPGEVRIHLRAVLQGTASLRDIEVNVLASREYFGRFRNDQAWIRGMINDVTERDPAPAEVRNWMRHHQSVRGDRLRTAKAFLESVDADRDRPAPRERRYDRDR